MQARDVGLRPWGVLFFTADPNGLFWIGMGSGVVVWILVQ